jgi:hypothetical protein
MLLQCWLVKTRVWRSSGRGCLTGRLASAKLRDSGPPLGVGGLGRDADTDGRRRVGESTGVSTYCTIGGCLMEWAVIAALAALLIGLGLVVREAAEHSHK